MSKIRVFLFLVLSYLSVKCAPLTGKALLCRDPDTGKLYPINATWISTTFCGNYTCSLRKPNVTLMEPIRQINITNLPNLKTIKSVITVTHKIDPAFNNLIQKTRIAPNIDESESVTKNFYVRKPDKLKPEKPDKLKTEKPDIKTNSTNNTVTKTPDEDRLLTEEEINHIAKVLHTVKKSDLDAIVEIYDIAREITKEMEKPSDNEIVEEAIKLIKEDDLHKNRKHKYPSYWYDPLANKGRVLDRNDLVQQNTITMPTVSKSDVKMQPYFSSVRTNNDIGKLPYYYPVTNFQRLASYTYPLHQPTRRPVTDHTLEQYKKICTKPRELEKEKLIQTSRLLPYPFTNIHGLNVSDYHIKSKTYYNNNAWAMDYHKKQNNFEPNFNAFIPIMPKAILMNPYLSQIQDVEQPAHRASQPPNIPAKQNKKSLLGEMYPVVNKRPEWKTEQLSLDILEDIRAHIDTSRMIKAYPWRKKTKLEKVGKVIKMDELKVTAERHRRSINETNKTNSNAAKKVEKVIVTKKEEKKSPDSSGEYETYLDTVTCETKTEMGFFRMGNMSQPYPACCPQLVNKAR